VDRERERRPTSTRLSGDSLFLPLFYLACVFALLYELFGFTVAACGIVGFLVIIFLRELSLYPAEGAFVTFLVACWTSGIYTVMLASCTTVVVACGELLYYVFVVDLFQSLQAVGAVLYAPLGALGVVAGDVWALVVGIHQELTEEAAVRHAVLGFAATFCCAVACIWVLFRVIQFIGTAPLRRYQPAPTQVCVLSPSNPPKCIALTASQCPHVYTSHVVGCRCCDLSTQRTGCGFLVQRKSQKAKAKGDKQGGERAAMGAWGSGQARSSQSSRHESTLLEKTSSHTLTKVRLAPSTSPQ
jgi:hypothetical protein